LQRELLAFARRQRLFHAEMSVEHAIKELKDLLQPIREAIYLGEIVEKRLFGEEDISTTEDSVEINTPMFALGSV
jgi:hypothetical protein